jgi:hypothetical protein
MVLIKWEKNHVLILKTSLQKKWQKIFFSWFQLLFIIIQINKQFTRGNLGENVMKKSSIN